MAEIKTAEEVLEMLFNRNKDPLSKITGTRLYNSLSALNDATSEMITKSREVLKPKLEGQGKTLSEESNISSLITDIDKLTVVDTHMTSMDLPKLRFEQSSLFTNTTLPSNVIMMSDTRIIFVEDGLLYLIDYDVLTLEITNRYVHKLDKIWEYCEEGLTIKLVASTDYFWVIPSRGDDILCVYGEGVLTDGMITYNIIPLPISLSVNCLVDKDGIVAICGNAYAYYYIENFEPSKSCVRATWTTIINRFFITAICDGAPNYVATDKGEIYCFDYTTKEFTYVIDTFNERDYDVHFENWKEDPSLYLEILAMNKNGNRWIVVEKSNRVLNSYSWEDSDTIVEDFEVLEMTDPMTVAGIAVNKLGDSDRSIIYGFDDTLTAVAYSFRSSFEGLTKMLLNATVVPEHISFAIYEERAVLLSLYEYLTKASDYFTEEEIEANGYMDFSNTLTRMRVASYSDYQYSFGPEFHPGFVPDKICYGNDRCIIIDTSASSKDYNIALSTDEEHWQWIHIDPSIAIDIQDITFGGGYFLLCGSNNSTILVSKTGYTWESIDLGSMKDLMFCTYNDILKSFFMLPYTATEIINYDPMMKMLTSIPTNVAGAKEAVNITSAKQNIIFTINHDGIMESYISSFTEDADPSQLASITFTKRDNIIFSAYNIDGRCYTRESDDSTTSYLDLYKKTDDGSLYDNYGESTSISNTAGEHEEVIKFLNVALMNHISYADYIKYASDLGNLNIQYLSAEFKAASINAKSLLVAGDRLYTIHPIRNKFARISYLMNTECYEPMAEPEDVVPEKRLHMIYGDDVIDYFNPNSISYKEKNDYIESFPVYYSKLTTTTDCAAMAFGNGVFVRIYPGLYSHYSLDGIIWNQVRMPSAGVWQDIVFGNGLFVATRYVNTSNGDIYYSADGINWTKAVLPSAQGWSYIEFNGTFFIVVAKRVCSCQVVLTSDNGIAWNEIILSQPVDKVRKIDSVPGSLFVYSGIESASRIYEFTDPLTFTSTPIPITGPRIEYTKFDNMHVLLASAGLAKTMKVEGGVTTSTEITLPNVDHMFSFTHQENIPGFVLFSFNTTNNFYIEISTDKDHLFSNLIEIELPLYDINESQHLILYHENKLYVATRKPVVIDISNTLPEVIEGSFFVKAGAAHNQSLPFRADHVFLFNADSESNGNKFLLGEINNTNHLQVDGSNYESITFYNTYADAIKYRVDTVNRIIDSGFIFMNSTSSDRYINFIAIKEDRYK